MPKIPNSPLGQAKNASKLASKAPKPAGPGPAMGLRQRKAAELKAKLEGGPPSPATPTLPATLPNPPIQPSGMRQVRAAQLKAKMEGRVRIAEKPTSEEVPLDREIPCDAETRTEEQALGAGPVGQGEHIVRQGECISSIAKDTGHFWETIWQDPANTELREVRQNPNVLLPDDRVHVPPLRRKQEPGETEMRHRFVRRGEPTWIRLRLIDWEERPRANRECRLLIDGEAHQLMTDADGLIQTPISALARSVRLFIDREEYDLSPRCLDPITSIGGVQARLRNLGYYWGSIDGLDSAEFRAAVRTYQQSRKLALSGTVDRITAQRIVADHRS